MPDYLVTYHRIHTGLDVATTTAMQIFDDLAGNGPCINMDSMTRDDHTSCGCVDDLRRPGDDFDDRWAACCLPDCDHF